MKQSTRLHNWLLKFDRTFSDKIWWQIIILLGIIFVALIIGLVICYFLTFGKNCRDVNFFEWALYLLIDGNALSNIYTDIYPGGERPWLTLLFAILGSLLGMVVFGGMLISVLSNMLERRIENYRKGKNTYVKENHHVILGYDEIVPSIIKQICTNKDAYVLLQSSVPSEEIAEKIHSSIAQDCEKRVIIKNGHRSSIKDLEELKLNQACSIYVVGDRTKPSHDAMNIDCMEEVYKILEKNKDKGLPESITTVFEDPDTYAALQVTDLFEDIRKLKVEFIPYNFYSDWAKQMFVDTDGVRYPFIDGNGISSKSDKHVHVVIVGTSSFGVTLGIEAAKMLHFPNFDGKNNRTEITFIDLNADKELQLFMTRTRHFFEVQEHKYGEFVRDGNKLVYKEETKPATVFSGEDANFLDIEFRFVKGDIYTKEVQALITDWACDEKQILSLIFAMRDSRSNMAIAMNMNDKVYECGTRIFIRQNTSSKFVDKVREMSQIAKEKMVIGDDGTPKALMIKGRYSNVFPFGMTDIIFDINKRAQQMAECVNYIYNYYYDNNYLVDENGNPIQGVNMDDEEKKKFTLSHQLVQYGERILQGMMKYNKEDVLENAHQLWIGLKVSDQWSNLYSAYNIGFRERSLNAEGYTGCRNLSAETLLKMAEVEHNRWNVEKLLMGFRKPQKEEDAYQLDLDRYEDNQRKGVFNGFKKTNNKNQYIHGDIRPFNQLNEIQEIDKEIIRYIPWFIEMANKNY